MSIILAPFTNSPQPHPPYTRPNRLHVVLHDCGLTGIPGAQLALDRLSPETKQLTLSHNALTSAGVLHLFRGLIRLRSEWATSIWSDYPSPSSSRSPSRDTAQPRKPAKVTIPWALTKLTLNSNRIDDDALEGIALFLEGDGGMEELYLAGNQITGGSHIQRLAKAVARSNLKVLSFNNNHLTPASLSLLLAALSPWPFPSTVQPSSSSFPVESPSLSAVAEPSAMHTETPTQSKRQSLTDLHLSSNPLTADCLPSLLQFLISESLASPATSSPGQPTLPVRTPSVSPTRRPSSYLSPSHLSSNPMLLATSGTSSSSSLQLLALNATSLHYPPLPLLAATAYWNTSLEVGVQVGSCWGWEGFVGGPWRPWGTGTDDAGPELAVGGHFEAAITGDEPMGTEEEVREGLQDLMKWEGEICLGKLRIPDGAGGYVLQDFSDRIKIPAHLPSYSPILPGLLSPVLNSDVPISHHRLDLLSRQIMTLSTNALGRIAERNKRLREDVLRCALAVLPGARCVLGGRKPRDGEVAREVLDGFGMSGMGLPTPPNSHKEGTEDWFKDFPGRRSPSFAQPFRLLDLPTDILPIILFHLQPNPHLLSPTQLKSLLTYASSPQTLNSELRALDALYRQRAAAGNKVTLGPGGPRGWRSSGGIGGGGVRAGPGHWGRGEWGVVVALGEDRLASEQLRRVAGGAGKVWGDEWEVVEALMGGLGCGAWDGRV